MAIKIKVNRKPAKNFTYPKLMIHECSGMIVLFTSHQTGTVMNSRIGEYREDWIVENFYDYNDNITLSNEVVE